MIWRQWFARPGRARRAEPKAREAGAAWRAANPLRPLAEDATVVFAMPLIGKAKAQDWDIIERNLAATIRSLRAQSSTRWEAIICGQDVPDGILFDEQVRFLHHPVPVKADKLTDRPAKLRQLVEHLAEDWKRDGYFFMLDADDLLHPDLVEHVVSGADPSGYVLPEGYMLDAPTGDLAYLGENRIRYPHSGRFYSHCGSCAAIRMDFRDGPAFMEPLNARGTHKSQFDNLAAYGIRPLKVPFGGVIYLVNHGENLRERRGKMDSKLRYLDRNRLGPARASSVREQFALKELLGNDL